MGEDELRATQSTFEFSMTLEGGAPGIRSQLGGTSNSGSALLFKSSRDMEAGATVSSSQLYAYI
jgi:DNA-dependent protein kinase catalytic subunit